MTEKKVDKYIELIYKKIKDANKVGLRKITIDRPNIFITENKNELTAREKQFLNDLAEHNYKIKLLPKFKIWDPRYPTGIGIYKINW